MNIIGVLKEALEWVNSWNKDKTGRLRREIKALEGKIKRLQARPPTKGTVDKIWKLKKQIKIKKDYLIQGAK